MRHFSLTSLLAGAALVALSATGALAESVWNRGANGDVQSLDPHKTETIEEFNITNDLFMGLMTSDAGGNAISGASIEQKLSADGKTWTMTLRPGATWSDGSPVTAEDFVYSMRRLVTPETAAAYAYLANPIINAEDIIAGKKKPEELGVKAIDASTLEVTLKSPTPYFLELMAHNSFFPVQKANVEKFGNDFVKPGNLVSNGSFVLTENVPNDHIKIVKNPKFYDVANIALDAVNIIPTEDRAAGIKRYKAGEVDSMNDFPTEQLADLRKELGNQIHEAPQLGTYYYMFKFKKAPWDNTKLRNAISMVIDREYLAEKAWAGSMIPAYSMVPPGLEGYTSQMAEFSKMDQLDREDAAKKIFEELGISPAKPMKLEIRYNTAESHKNTAVAIQDMLKPFGFDVSLITTDGKTHYSYLEQKGDFDLARAGWIADYKDPGTFLDLGHTGFGNNYGDWSNAEFDKFMDAAASESDAAKRLQLLSQAEAILVKEQSIVPLLYYANHNIVSPKIKGFVDNVMDKHPSRFVSKE
jgi:oligopeptide transport system substrate-binding protein